SRRSLPFSRPFRLRGLGPRPPFRPWASLDSRSARPSFPSLTPFRGSLWPSSAFLSPSLILLPFRTNRSFYSRRRRAALDPQFESSRHVRVQTQFHIMLTQRPHRMLEMNLLFIERDIKLRL